MNVKTVFDDAEAECKRINSNLFSIPNPYENRYLHDNFHEKMWIGYRDKGISGTWNWTDGSRGIYTNWASEADDDSGQRRDCVVLKSEDGKWKDLPCTSTLPFLCKHKSGKDSAVLPVMVTKGGATGLQVPSSQQILGNGVGLKIKYTFF